MPRILLLFALATALRGQGLIDLNPAQPKVGQAVTFSLRTPTPPASVRWDFGDGSPPADGGIVIVYSFRKPGTFAAKASFQVAGTLVQVQRLVAVDDGRLIRFTPSSPIAGAKVAFVAVGFQSSTVRWSFGDGTSEPSGSTHQSHVYAAPGTYQVRAQDGPDASSQIFATTLTVLGQGPAAPFTISYLALRWTDGTTDLSASKDEAGLAAYADLKLEGTGILQAQWLVDDRPFRGFSLPLGFAQRITLGSGSSLPLQGFGPGAVAVGPELGLPTNIPGEHRVTLQILGQPVGFEIPVLRYFVTLSDPDLPNIASIDPGRAHKGQELDLVLTGRKFREGMSLVLGRDLAQISPISLQSASLASVRIYVSPAAKPGPRAIQCSLGGKKPPTVAWLQIVKNPGKQ